MQMPIGNMDTPRCVCILEIRSKGDMNVPDRDSNVAIKVFQYSGKGAHFLQRV